MNDLELTGQVRTHVVELSDPACALHVHAAVPFMNLRRAALAAGFDLQPVSGFRDFERQLSIWNAKFSGARPLYDSNGWAVDALQMSPSERVDAILRWSALPGASRHHWGSDLDLIDANATAPDYRVQLSPAEFSATGPFAPLAEWLATHAARFGFFRPFRGVLSGVQAEPWHYSFAPLAEPARRSLTPSVLRAALTAAPLMGKDPVMARLEELHSRYVAAIDWP
ncbi:MAG TPA: M15 family metallopeptidase [Steroidobacteraceae bacterium]|nr:M15 family metallopeptidase [Steroidobacteraceae bacterium]